MYESLPLLIMLLVCNAVLVIAVCVIAGRSGAIAVNSELQLSLLRKLLQKLNDAPPAEEPPPEPEPARPEPLHYDPYRPFVIPPEELPPPEPEPTPQKRAAEPRPASDFEIRAKKLLRQIWNWIVVGEEFRPKNVAVEYSIATAWLVRVAMLLLLFGIGFFIKFSHDNNLLPPLCRILIGVAVGLAMIGAGCRLAHKRYHMPGMGLIGAGVVTLYFAVFAAWFFYDAMLPGIAAFVLMGAVSGLGAVLALRYNSLLIAVLASLGGYLTPFLIADAAVPAPIQLTYALLLGGGLLWIAVFRNWKLLNLIAFTGTYILYFDALRYTGWLTHYGLLIAFLAAYFVLFSLQSIVYNLGHQIKITLLELLLLFANFMVFLATALPLTIAWSGGRRAAAAVTAALAAFYMVQIAVFLRCRIRDRNLLTTMLVLAAFALALTFPLLLDGEWITMAWALQALAMIFLGVRIGSAFLRGLAMVLYTVTLGRLLSRDVDVHFSAPDVTYWSGLLGRLLSLGSVALSFAGAAWTLRRAGRSAGPLTAERESDFEARPEWDSLPGELFAWASAALLAVWGIFDAGRFARYAYAGLGPFLRSWVLLAALAFILWRLRRRGGKSVCIIPVIAAALLGIYYLFGDITGGPLGVWHSKYSFTDGLLRLGQYLPVALLFLYWAARMKRDRVDASGISVKFFIVEALAIWFIYSSLEVYRCSEQLLPGTGAGAVSVLWGVYALLFVVSGLRRRMRALRFTGLALFVATAVKILLIDLGHLATWQRVAALILIGLATLGGALVYTRFRDIFTEDGRK